MDLWPFPFIDLVVAALALAMPLVSVAGGVVVVVVVVVDVVAGCIDAADGGGGGDADGGELATPTGPSLLATCGWLVSVSVRLQHGNSAAASTTADIVDWAFSIHANWIDRFFIINF